MIVLRCTKRLLAGVGPDALAAEPPVPKAPLGEWYVNVVPFPGRGRSAVMYTSSVTLLTVVTLGRVLRTTLPQFRERLPALLHRLALPDTWIDEQQRALSEFAIAPTRDRRVLGSMNDLADQLWHRAAAPRRHGELDAMDALDALELELAEVPMSMIGYRYATDLVAELARR